MNKTEWIHHTCLCGKKLKLSAAYAKYVIEFLNLTPNAGLICPHCNAIVPVEQLLAKHLKRREVN